MTIAIDDAIPAATVYRLGDTIEPIDTGAFFAARRIVLFAVPGAFTPTCSSRHLPGYIEQLDAFTARGVEVACVAVNDVFVMDAWARSQQVPAALTMLADGNGEFVTALGLIEDDRAFGMGLRARRFALFADDGRVRVLHVEAPGELRTTTAEAMLAALPA